jgi:1-deoxyxylulose-5-phosphate synthase
MSGKFKPDDTSDENVTQVYYSEENFERLRRAQILARRKNAISAQIGLAYVLQQAFPVSALIGSTTMSNLESTLGTVNVKLKLEEMDFLDLNIPEGREI